MLLQTALHQLSRWCEVNMMVVNPAKSKLISFHRKQAFITSDFSLDGTHIERCNLVRDLGVMMDASLNFSEHIDNICSKALRMLGFVFRVARFGISLRLLAHLYRALVRQNLEFASVIWSPYQLGQIDRLQAVQRRFARVLGLKMGYNYTEVPIAAVEAEFGLLPLSTRRAVFDMVLLFKILNGIIDCSPLLDLINIRVPSGTRSQSIFEVRHMGTNYLLHSPIPRMLRDGNRISGLVDFFSDSIGPFRRAVIASAVDRVS